MTKFLSVSLLSLAMAACANTPEPVQASLAPQNRGMVTIAGVSAAQALGAVDTSKLVGSASQQVTANQLSAVPPTATPPAASGGNAIAVEGVSPAAVLGAIDPTKLVSDPPATNLPEPGEKKNSN